MVRSWLFVPGRSAEKLQKARMLSADALIFDLEDAVSPGEKDTAREIVASELNANYRENRYVRVNAVESDYVFEDVFATVGSGVSGYILPKVETMEDVLKFDYLVRKIANQRNVMHEIEIVPLIETAKGVMNALQIGGASCHVSRLGFGAIDLMLDLNTNSIEADTILYARQMLVFASKAAGLLPPIDSVHMQFAELDGIEIEARRARCMGFGGKFVIHPNQIGIVNEIFSLDMKQAEHAAKIVAAYEKAVSEGFGVVKVDGQMVDLPVYENAKQILKQHES